MSDENIRNLERAFQVDGDSSSALPFITALVRRDALSSHLNQQLDSLAELLRAYCRSQKELWQQVPYWALEADGVFGYSSKLNLCYKEGLWEVVGTYCLYVDCETGELVNQSLPVLAETWSIIRAFPDFYQDLNRLNAGDVIKKLESEIQRLTSCSIYDERAKKEHLDHISTNKVSKIYCRNQT